MKVLCLSANLELAALRLAVLAFHGDEVHVARSKKEAEQLLEANTYDASLLCHSISVKTAEQLVAIFRQRNPDRCVIFISHNPWQQSSVKANRSVCAIDGPEILVEAVLSCRTGYHPPKR
jgi:DNA-binding response OmpR family regulator